MREYSLRDIAGSTAVRLQQNVDTVCEREFRTNQNGIDELIADLMTKILIM